MARYNPFFTKAGMREVEYEPNKDELRILHQLSKFGFNIELCASTEYNLQVINKLTKEQVLELAELLTKVRNVIGNLTGRIDIEKEDAITLLQDKTTLAEATHWLATIAQKKCYYIWENPELKLEVKAK
jgi:hypothetical protein